MKAPGTRITVTQKGKTSQGLEMSAKFVTGPSAAEYAEEILGLGHQTRTAELGGSGRLRRRRNKTNQALETMPKSVTWPSPAEFTKQILGLVQRTRAARWEITAKGPSTRIGAI